MSAATMERAPIALADELLHFASKPVRSIKSKSQGEPGHKPDGFWVSVGSAWADWCLSESFHTDALRVIHRIVLAPDANILRLQTVADLDDFTDEYGHERRYGAGIWSVNWYRVAEQYDGIIISPYQWERRHSLGWYYSWDVASGCLWNAKAVASIEHVDLASVSSPRTEGRDPAESADSSAPSSDSPSPTGGRA